MHLHWGITPLYNQEKPNQLQLCGEFLFFNMKIWGSELYNYNYLGRRY